MEDIFSRFYDMLLLYGVRIVTALMIFIIGRWVAKGLQRLVEKLVARAKGDETLVAFAGNFAYIMALTFVVVAALGQLGIQTASLIAIIGAAGLAVGLALQGSLANFAAGVLMLIFRPFQVNDYIEAAGTAGTVEKIHIFTTQLKTPDNKTVIAPNARITGGNIVNWSVKGTRRVDLVFGIGYQDDIDKARRVIEDILAADSRILKEPAPFVAVTQLADSSVNFSVRPWTKTSDYWNVYCSLTEAVKKGFDAASISIPFPQRDVHLYPEQA